jgi:NADPH:quinone reductase-like Zn-dependent oxidoreductase
MKVIIFDRLGNPEDVLQVREFPNPEPGQGQVRVRMICSPINPSDLLMVRGEYGRLPPLPATPGFEGCGIVEANGGGLLGRLRLGRRVAVLNPQGGNWQEYVIVPAKLTVPVSRQVPDEQAATFFVNPASAWIMTRSVLKIPSGGWLLQTAAGSALGRMVIRLGIHYGFRTINVVRRKEQGEELRRLGADAVICSSEESLEERAKAITGGAGPLFGIDAVGGETGSAVVRALAPGGRLLVYGSLSGKPITVDSRVLISEDKRIEGFWLSTWARNQSILTMLRLFRRINQLLAAGILTTQIEASFPLEEIKAAVKAANQPGRPGKVLLRIRPGN